MLAGLLETRVRPFLVLVGLLGAGSAASAQLPPPPAPPQNPVTPAKVTLGKILFWDEQLSSDGTMACGTCHQTEAGGGDRRFRRTAGGDGQLGSPDDLFGSPGVVFADGDNNFLRHPEQNFRRQVTGRASLSFLMAAYAPELFWDGRAGTTFIDPQTGAVSIPFGGALESQSVDPPVSSTEMAHQDRDWDQVAARLQEVRPLALATNLPPDLTAALRFDPSYGDLFAATFGTANITAELVAFALASYQRSLIPDQTPFDRFQQGDPTALTASQQAGLRLFMNSARCGLCHVPPFFTDFQFHNVGVRPVAEDRGRQDVSGDFADRGRFKTPTLRSAGLRPRFFHTGGVPGLDAVVAFYNRGGNFADNQDPRIAPLGLSALERAQLVDFVSNGLVDPRVALALPPFDRPTLFSERQPVRSNRYCEPHAGTGPPPAILADDPAHLGNADFRLGVGAGLGGSDAVLALAFTPAPAGSEWNGIPLNVSLNPLPILLALSLSGAGPADGYGTVHLALPGDPLFVGVTFFAQWFVEDAGAIGGFSATRGAVVTLF